MLPLLLLFLSLSPLLFPMLLLLLNILVSLTVVVVIVSAIVVAVTVVHVVIVATVAVIEFYSTKTSIACTPKRAPGTLTGLHKLSAELTITS